MTIKQRLKNRPQLYLFILKALNAVNYFNRRFNMLFPRYKITQQWKARLELVKASSDNAKLHYVPDAGKVFRNYQVMHNGLKITLGSYYDYGNTILLQENKGVHEPQEEYVFQQILQHLPEGATMFELGSYWAFYSMWFAKEVKSASCFMIEPDPHKMNFGQLNFKLNKFKGTFDLGFIDEYTDLKKSIPTYHIDYLVEKHEVNFIHILHSDIQGYEYKMLKGAEKTISEGKVGYIFISTHSNDLHSQCENFLRTHDFDIICSADLNETFSWDGLLVAKHKKFPGLSSVEISKRNKST